MQDEIRQRIEAAITGAQASVSVDGNRATINVVASFFAGMSRVKKQQEVYACIADLIADGALHAVTIKADAPE
jgi:acid stress-induced BolA-like protein IbaG/YrbA